MLAATFGLGIGAVVMHAIGIDSGLVITAVALAAAIVMIALVGYLDLKKWLIVFVTAFGGSLAIFSGILIALGTLSLSEIQSGINPVSAVVNDSLIWIILWGAVGIVGIVFQARTTKDFFQGEDYDYYHQIVKREQDVLGTATVEEEAEQVIAPSGHTDEDEEQSVLPDELVESSPENKMNDQETINEELSEDVEPDSEAPQDDPIDESETKDS